MQGTKGKFLNVIIMYRNTTRKGLDELLDIIQLIEGLFVKYANAVEHKVPGRHSSGKTAPRLREKNCISRIPPTEEIRTTEMVCSMLKLVYWCDACDIGLSMEFFLQLRRPAEFLRKYDTITTDFYRLIEPENSFKAMWITSPIQYTFLNIVSKLEKQNSIPN
jgi:hypothetical protein